MTLPAHLSPQSFRKAIDKAVEDKAELFQNPLMRGLSLSNNEPFIYLPVSGHELSGEMILNQISYYLELTQQHREHIIFLQDGICEALSYFFVESDARTWDACIKNISEWDGKLSSLDATRKYYFDLLWNKIEQYQIKDNDDEVQCYLGDNIIPFLLYLSGNCILKNPKHTIGVKRLEDGSWLLYNSNFLSGTRVITDYQTLTTTINECLGPIISVVLFEEHKNNPWINRPAVLNPAAFIQNGGIIALSGCIDSDGTLGKTQIDRNLLSSELSKEVLLEGLFLREIGDPIPAWAAALLSTMPEEVDDAKDIPAEAVILNSPKLRELTYFLLERLWTVDENFHHTIQQSLEESSQDDKSDLIAITNQTLPKTSTLRLNLVHAIQTRLQPVNNVRVTQSEQAFFLKQPQRQERLEEYASSDDYEDESESSEGFEL